MNNEKQEKLYVSIIGAPNVGKSTFLNAILKQKVSIVSDKPQTTRERIYGILTEGNKQLIFLDTPGINKKTSTMSTAINQVAKNTLYMSNLNLFFFAANKLFHSHILDLHKTDNDIAVITKVDTSKKGKLLLLTDFLRNKGFKEIFFISSKMNDGLVELLDFIKTKTVEEEWDYDNTTVSTATVSQQLIEATREAMFNLCDEEIPYITDIANVSITSKKGLIVHQNIIIKKSAFHIILSNIKEISKLARKNAEELTKKKIHLFIKVVEPKKTN